MMRWRAWVGWLPLVVYTAAALTITWPLAAQFTTHALGAAYGDEYETIRLIWWMQYAVQHGLNPFYQGLLGYPDGFFSATQWAEPLRWFPAALPAFAIGAVAAHNLWEVATLVLNGLSAFYVCRTVLRAESNGANAANAADDAADGAISPALIGGLIFMTYPALQGQVSGGHIGIVGLYGLPLYALCLWRIVTQAATWRTVALGSAAFVITALGNTTQVVYMLFPTTLFLLGYFGVFARRSIFRRGVIVRLAALLAVSGAALLPFFIPLYAALTAPVKTADLQETGWVRYSADPLTFVSPSPFTPWGMRLAPDYARAALGTNSIEGSGYLGVIALALAAAGVRTARRAAYPWLALAVGAMLLSLGPLLKWRDQPVVYTLGDYRSYVVLPWALLQSLPVLSAARTPGRFNLVTGLALGIVASLGAQIAMKRLPHKAARRGLTALLLIGIGVESALFFPALTTSAAIPGYLSKLAEQADVRAVFDVPWRDPLAAKEALYWQTAHRKPLIAGQVARGTPVDPAKLNVLQAEITGAASVAVVSLLSDQGIDRVIVHRAYWPDLAPIVRQLGAPLYADDRAAVFAVPTTVGNTPAIVYAPDSQTPGAWSVYVARDTFVSVGLTLGGAPISEHATYFYTRDGQSVATAPGDRVVRLVAGFHSLGITGTALSLSTLTLADPPLTERAPGGALALLGSRLTMADRRLTVDLVWQAAQKPDGDYHLFVHLTDGHGAIVAQYDGQPGGGAYPTARWSADQAWSERVSLDMHGVPPGTYQVAVGWYRYPDMQRLPVSGDALGAQNGLNFVGDVTFL